jgi:ATP-binding cassette subfamily B (MDR/TAP) protein 1
MFLGGLAAAGNGLTFPLFSLIFGNMADSFGPNATDD